MPQMMVCEICQAELALRIAEAILDLDRPQGKTPDECLAYFDETNRQLFLNAATNAMDYIAQCMAKGTPLQ